MKKLDVNDDMLSLPHYNTVATLPCELQKSLFGYL